MKNELDPGLPRHVAVVMDGNGRWAERRGLPRLAGHQAGYRAVKTLVREAGRRGIRHLTLFAFSSENWGRPADEVAALMALFLKALRREVADLHRHGIRLDFIGDRDKLSLPLRRIMEDAQRLTAANEGLMLHVAVSYGGRWDMVNAAKRLAVATARGDLDPRSIDERTLAAQFTLGAVPDPDLFIRTGGEYRISNFLLWNLAYTELYFTETLWPDFDKRAFSAALSDFAGRQRQFGQVSAARFVDYA